MADNQAFTGDGLGLPYSLEAEQAVLGAVLVEPQCMNDVADALRTEHFICPSIRQSFA